MEPGEGSAAPKATVALPGTDVNPAGRAPARLAVHCNLATGGPGAATPHAPFGRPRRPLGTFPRGESTSSARRRTKPPPSNNLPIEGKNTPTLPPNNNRPPIKKRRSLFQNDCGILFKQKQLPSLRPPDAPESSARDTPPWGRSERPPGALPIARDCSDGRTWWQRNRRNGRRSIRAHRR